MTRISLSRRAAPAAIAGSVLVPAPGCGGAAVVRLPWAKILGAVIRFVKDHGSWVLVLIGLYETGQQISK